MNGSGLKRSKPGSTSISCCLISTNLFKWCSNILCHINAFLNQLLCRRKTWPYSNQTELPQRCAYILHLLQGYFRKWPFRFIISPIKSIIYSSAQQKRLMNVAQWHKYINNAHFIRKVSLLTGLEIAQMIWEVIVIWQRTEEYFSKIWQKSSWIRPFLNAYVWKAKKVRKSCANPGLQRASFSVDRYHDSFNSSLPSKCLTYIVQN